VQAARAIRNNCRGWIVGLELYSKEMVASRFKLFKGAKEILKSIISIFVLPGYTQADKIYIFQGSKTQIYLKLFDKSKVVLLGSRKEKKLAIEHGYGFLWDFPLRSSVAASVYRGNDLLLYWQLIWWLKFLSRKHEVIMFLSEDTQEVGTFLCQFVSLLPSKVKTVCIQHGYYNYHQPMRYEGMHCQYKLLWDDKQIALMNLNRDSSFSIGPPYIARAKIGSELPIIFVGTGELFAPRYYQAAVDTYTKIDHMLNTRFGISGVYRPHPNEYCRPEALRLLVKQFKDLDFSEIEDRLNGQRSIFVGNVSSVLFLAARSGHFVANFDMYEYWHKCLFDYHYKIDVLNIRGFIEWVEVLRSNRDNKCTFKNKNNDDPVLEFRRGLIELGITKESCLKGNAELIR